MELIHYVLVRRDLPFGTTLAMVGHAAADSMESWRGSWFRYKRKHAPITLVVLGVDDHKSLVKTFVKLKGIGLNIVPVMDSLIKQTMQSQGTSLLSIGVEPGSREFLSPFFKNYTLYKEFKNEDVSK